MDLKTLKKNKFNKEGIFFTAEKLANYLKEELYRYAGNEKIDEVWTSPAEMELCLEFLMRP